MEWDFLSNNETIPWSFELIQKFEDKWNWKNLWNIKNYIPTSEEFDSLYTIIYK